MIQDMKCSQDDAFCSHKNPRKIQEHIEHCNLAWIFLIKHYSYVCCCRRAITSISLNQTCALILAVVFY